MTIGLVLLSTLVAGLSPLTAEPAAAAVAPSARADAQAMLDSGRVTFATGEAEAQVRAYAAGTRRVHPGTGRYCNLSSVLLSALKQVVVTDRIAVRITSLNRWCQGIEAANWFNFHSVNRGGAAVDVDAVDGVRSTGGTPQDLQFIAAMTRALPTPAGLGQMTCAGQVVTVPSGWVRFPDGCDHVHIEYRGADPLAEPVPAPAVPRDFSADGRSDLLAVRQDGLLALYRGDGRGGFAAGGIGSIIGNGWQTMPLVTGGADYDGDGVVDVVATRYDGALLLYRGVPGGGFAAGTVVGPGWNVMTSIIGGGDYNDDGYADLLAVDRAGTLYLYPGTGDGGFGRGIVIGAGWTIYPRIIGGADFDGDGRPDLYGIDDAGVLWYYHGYANATFDPRVQRGWGWSAVFAVAGGADMNGDGTGDLYGRTADGLLLTWWATSAGFVGNAVPFGRGWEQMRSLL